jgi:hypothetical protein
MLFIVRTVRNTKIHSQIIYKNPVRTSQETQYISPTKSNRLMLFGETVAGYCKNDTEHTNALCDHKAVFLYIETFGTSSYCGP